MKRILIDTNAILRFLLLDVPNQAEEVKVLFEKAKAGKIQIIIPEVVFFETKHMLSGNYYGFEKNLVVNKLESILSASFLEVENKSIFLKALDYYKKTSLSLVDSFILAKAKLENLEIFTFDKNLKKISTS
ncbi:MAG TPA: PIN domain-containing protein [Patescibacteria group bacterium]